MIDTSAAPKTRSKRTAKRVADAILLRDGGYWAAVEYPRKPDGSRDKRKFGPFTSKADAITERDKRRHEARSGLVADPRKLTFNELADRWIEHKEARIPALSPSTVRQYKETVALRLKPAFSDCPVKKLTALYVAQVSGKLAKADRLDGRGGSLSDRSIQVTAVVLRSLLKQAERWGVVPTDLSSAVESRTVRRNHVEFLSSGDVKQLLGAAKSAGARTYAIFAVGLGCGLRRAELLGLQWRDIDFDAGTLRVERGVQKHARMIYVPCLTR
jgi:integrase